MKRIDRQEHEKHQHKAKCCRDLNMHLVYNGLRCVCFFIASPTKIHSVMVQLGLFSFTFSSFQVLFVTYQTFVVYSIDETLISLQKSQQQHCKVHNRIRRNQYILCVFSRCQNILATPLYRFAFHSVAFSNTENIVSFLYSFACNDYVYIIFSTL